MFAGHDHLISQLALEHALVTEVELKQVIENGRAEGRSLASVLVEDGHVRAGALWRALAVHLKISATETLPEDVPEAIRTRLTPAAAQRYQVVPFALTETGVAVAAVDPLAIAQGEELAFLLGAPVVLTVADPREVLILLHRFYPTGPVRSAASEVSPVHITTENLHEMAEQAPVVRLVSALLAQAVRDQASDIHFEPFEDEFKIRCRVDGALYDYPPPPPALALPVISRLKVMAGLNIAERRLPQDGRIKLQTEGRAVDLRVSTLPTQHGESVVLRVLDQSSVLLDLGQLGLPAPHQAMLETLITRPGGILLVTGPTGSGKTTTLYSCLKRLNAPGVKILTIEDPVEYEIDGVMQVPVNPGAGLTFATALRSFLRQDPDIVMVGEIRDLETAQIAIQASLTGHLVLTTLHTNDAASAITRLVDMGLEPYLLASSVEAVLAQRLVRRLCPRCRQPYQPDATEQRMLGMKLTAASVTWHRAVGCPDCHHTGYRGRLGLFELLPLHESHRAMIIAGVSLQELRTQIRAEGVATLREAGLAALANGDTTVDEILQAT